MVIRREFTLLVALLVALLASQEVGAQNASSDIRVFGYFQPQFFYQNGPEGTDPTTSFTLQQLNLFFQKDLGTGLTSFVNFEAINSFSTEDGWGSLKIEEAWFRYRRSKTFSIKVGLQIPIFNNFNEIKNRTPLVPYVIRPLVYEASLGKALNSQLYVPHQAFVQVFGWAPKGKWKFDYAAYLGNTDHIISGFPDESRHIGYTGIDTSSALLFGSRIGVRVGEFKLGFSWTVDKTNIFQDAAFRPQIPDGEYGEAPRYRSGTDLSFHIKRFWLEHESIGVLVDPSGQISGDVLFNYLTVGYEMTDRLQGYLSYQYLEQKIRGLDIEEITNIAMPTIGVAYTLEDQITLKSQYALVLVDVVQEPELIVDRHFHYLAFAISISF